MNWKTHYLLLILIVALAIVLFYRIGESAYFNDEEIQIDPGNLTNLPTSTPRPQIFRFIQEALKRRPRPTVPPEEGS